METKEEMEFKERQYRMAINSMYGSMGGKQQDLQSLYQKYIAEQKQKNRDKKIEEILEDEYTTI